MTTSLSETPAQHTSDVWYAEIRVKLVAGTHLDTIIVGAAGQPDVHEFVAWVGADYTTALDVYGLELGEDRGDRVATLTPQGAMQTRKEARVFLLASTYKGSASNASIVAVQVDFVEAQYP